MTQKARGRRALEDERLPNISCGGDLAEVDAMKVVHGRQDGVGVEVSSWSRDRCGFYALRRSFLQPLPIVSQDLFLP